MENNLNESPPITWKYYPDHSGGFIGSEDFDLQICDFRDGMGDIYGELIAEFLNLLVTPKEILDRINTKHKQYEM